VDKLRDRSALKNKRDLVELLIRHLWQSIFCWRHRFKNVIWSSVINCLLLLCLLSLNCNCHQSLFSSLQVNSTLTLFTGKKNSVYCFVVCCFFVKRSTVSLHWVIVLTIYSELKMCYVICRQTMQVGLTATLLAAVVLFCHIFFKLFYVWRSFSSC